MERRLAAILAADVVGYARLIRRDEEGTLHALKALRENLIEPTIGVHRGRIVKLMGDGLLAEFASVVDAVRAAAAIQHAIAAQHADGPADRRIVFRIGINLGDIVIDGDDIHGDGVNVAARLEARADEGGICISGAVHDEVRNRTDLAYESLGALTLKNIDRPINVWRVRLDRAPAPGTARGPTAPMADKPSIAILPFDNLSGDPEQAYFADGLAEDIITDLSKISGLFVIARNSAFAYRGQTKDVRLVCDDLGVRYVLEGSVRKAGGRVRINAQLIDGTTGGHLWAERYDRSLDDIFAVQDDVTSNIVDALRLTLSTSEQQRVANRAPVTLDAFDLYLKARDHFARYSRDDNDRARDYFERAFALDARYGEALVGVAYCFLREATQVWSARPDQSLGRALVLADQAIAMNQNLAEAHAVRGFVLLWQKRHDDGLASLEQATLLAPNNPRARGFYAMALNYAGQPEEGVREAMLAVRLDPRRSEMHAYFLFFLGMGHRLTGNAAAAIEAFDDALALIPDFLPARLIRAVTHVECGRVDDARTDIAQVRHNPSATLGWLAETLPFKRRSDLDAVLDALRVAGLPE